jgi:DNA-binding NarL/FixJ family response regulator
MGIIKIMVVDDHPVFRDGLSRLLQQQVGLEVIGEAANGEQAVDLSAKLKPDMILMDISMPGINGIEATKRIKAISPEIVILMLSAYNYHSYVASALKAGASGYLLKNTSLSEIIETIYRIHSGNDIQYGVHCQSLSVPPALGNAYP